MRPFMAAQERVCRSGVVIVAVAREYQNVFASAERQGTNGIPCFGFHKADRRVTCFYFYLWDTDLDATFIKVCVYCSYPIKVWINGHEWAKRQAAHAGIVSTRPLQRIRRLPGSGGAAGDLRPAWPGPPSRSFSGAGSPCCR